LARRANQVGPSAAAVRVGGGAAEAVVHGSKVLYSCSCRLEFRSCLRVCY
jgi:hypothetical protein